MWEYRGRGEGASPHGPQLRFIRDGGVFVTMMRAGKRASTAVPTGETTVHGALIGIATSDDADATRPGSRQATGPRHRARG